MINQEKWMNLAVQEAKKAYSIDEVPIGSIIVNNNKVIGRGYNQVENLKDCTAHSEIISITSASNSLNDWRLNNCSMFVTKEPCLMCYGAIINSRIERLYIGIGDSINGFKSKLNEKSILANQHLRHIESGILEYDCKALLQRFFIEKRKNNLKYSDE